MKGTSAYAPSQHLQSQYTLRGIKCFTHTHTHTQRVVLQVKWKEMFAVNVF